MRAALIEVVGGAPRVETLGAPSRTGDDQVLIKVEAAALNAIDLYIAAGHHRAGVPQLPYVPGIETVGTIIEGPDRGTRVRAAAAAGLVPGANGGLADLQLADRAVCIPCSQVARRRWYSARMMLSAPCRG